MGIKNINVLTSNQYYLRSIDSTCKGTLTELNKSGKFAVIGTSPTVRYKLQWVRASSTRAASGYYNFLSTPQSTQQTTLQNLGLCKRRPSLCIFQGLAVNSKTPSTVAINTHNKCDSKYKMRSTTRMQGLELWPFKCSNFCAKKRTKAATWLQKDEYSEWMMGCIGSTSMTKVSSNPKARSSAQQRRFAMSNSSEWTKDALLLCALERFIVTMMEWVRGKGGAMARGPWSTVLLFKNTLLLLVFGDTLIANIL
jgi:hypothetical protein